MSLFSKARKSLVEGRKRQAAVEAAGTARPGRTEAIITEPQREAAVGGAPVPRRPGKAVDATVAREWQFGDARGGDSDVIELDSLESANELFNEPEIPIDTEPARRLGVRESANARAATGDQTAGVTSAVPGGNPARAFALSDAIRLLKALPAAPRAETVVRLVRVTLGGANVRIEDLSAELDSKEKAAEEKIARLQAEANDLEKQLQAKRTELAAEQSEAKELIKVRSSLNMAMSPSSHRPPPIPAAAIKRQVGTGLSVQEA